MATEKTSVNIVSCQRCGKETLAVPSKKHISSRMFPYFIINRYGDYESDPIPIYLCHKCADELDEFLGFEEEGTDYFKNENEL